jgi:hypothetical protein
MAFQHICVQRPRLPDPSHEFSVVPVRVVRVGVYEDAAKTRLAKQSEVR